MRLSRNPAAYASLMFFAGAAVNLGLGANGLVRENAPYAAGAQVVRQEADAFTLHANDTIAVTLTSLEDMLAENLHVEENVARAQLRDVRRWTDLYDPNDPEEVTTMESRIKESLHFSADLYDAPLLPSALSTLNLIFGFVFMLGCLGTATVAGLTSSRKEPTEQTYAGSQYDWP